MIITTKGIVMRTTKYGDTSLIVKVFTKEQGNQSFIIKNAFRKNSRFHVSTFGPLSKIELSYDDNSKGSLKYFKDVSPYNHDAELFFDPVKNSILLFYNEILYKLLSDSGQDSDLFDFIENEIELLDTMPENHRSNLPSEFIIRLSEISGYSPEDNYSEMNSYFYIPESQFVNYYFDNQMFLPAEESFCLHQMLNGVTDVQMTRTVRINVLRGLVAYLQVHNEHIKKIDSLDILSSVLH